jgi:LysR family glycine cleavage system transcriptional activator
MNAIHMRRFRNIPPLQYLLGFEAAARLQSFSKAAEELGLSQSAVSHEMRLLEAKLGQALFRRQGRSMALTDAGHDYHRTVRAALEGLESGYQRLAPYKKPGSVIIYSPPDFAARWLLPRLPELIKAAPNCEPWIDTSGKEVNFDSMEVSIAIYRARSPVTAVPTLELFSEMLIPVANHSLIKKPLRQALDVMKFTLLHDERPEGWNEWLESAGVVSPNISAGLDFSDREFALKAAERGYGIALCDSKFSNEDSPESNLKPVHPHALKTGFHWFASAPESELKDDVTKAVWNWLGQNISPVTSQP